MRSRNLVFAFFIHMEMPMEHLKPVVDELHCNGAVCALETGIGDYVRCTPLEYSFYGVDSSGLSHTKRHLRLDLRTHSES